MYELQEDVICFFSRSRQCGVIEIYLMLLLAFSRDFGMAHTHAHIQSYCGKTSAQQMHAMIPACVYICIPRGF